MSESAPRISPDHPAVEELAKRNFVGGCWADVRGERRARLLDKTRYDLTAILPLLRQTIEEECREALIDSGPISTAPIPEEDRQRAAQHLRDRGLSGELVEERDAALAASKEAARSAVDSADLAVSACDRAEKAEQELEQARAMVKRLEEKGAETFSAYNRVIDSHVKWREQEERRAEALTQQLNQVREEVERLLGKAREVGDNAKVGALVDVKSILDSPSLSGGGQCETCGGSGNDPANRGWEIRPGGRWKPCPDCQVNGPSGGGESSGVEKGFTDWERGAIHDFARRSLDALSAPEAGSEVGQRWLALLNKTRDQREAADAR